jgi:multidrug efflux pump subunit AcrB
LLLHGPDISQVEVSGGREYGVKVQIPQDKLCIYGLTQSDVSII